MSSLLIINIVKRIGFQIMDYFDHVPIIDYIIHVHLFQNLLYLVCNIYRKEF